MPSKLSLGMVGLGKLGLPVAVAIAQKFRVYGYDVDSSRCRYREYEHRELGPNKGHDFQVYFKSACYSKRSASDLLGLEFVDNLRQLVDRSDIIFLAVQTPHQPRFEGCEPLGWERADFDYSFLVRVLGDLAPLVRQNQLVVIISTVLPGTIREKILPILNGKCELVYSPLFISMGTVMYDFLRPEFVLIGEEDGNGQPLVDFYCDMGFSANYLRMSIESAELAKIGYNAYITQKITFINSLMEIAHKIPGCNINDVTRIFKESHRLLHSFGEAGMSFGGACFPRDCIALSWLAGKVSLSNDVFNSVTSAREDQTLWLAELVCRQAEKSNLGIVLLGKAFKPETAMTTGSPALLLASALKQLNAVFLHYDPFVDPKCDLTMPAVFFVATKHECFAKQTFPRGSVVIDPWRYIAEQDGVTVIPIGIGR